MALPLATDYPPMEAKLVAELPFAAVALMARERRVGVLLSLLFVLSVPYVVWLDRHLVELPGDLGLADALAVRDRLDPVPHLGGLDDLGTERQRGRRRQTECKNQPDQHGIRVGDVPGDAQP